jgi:hypothetical protein
MEYKKCNRCGKSKPIELFYRLRKDKPWRRAYCISCHKTIDKENAKVRKFNKKGAATIVLLFISLSFALSQSLEQKRQIIIDSINYFRADPVQRVNECYGVSLDPQTYIPRPAASIDYTLNMEAQIYAEWMANTGNYEHSYDDGYTYESIARTQNWRNCVSGFIIDKGWEDWPGHRIHLLGAEGDVDNFGIGIAEKDGITYICIRTYTDPIIILDEPSLLPEDSFNPFSEW